MQAKTERVLIHLIHYLKSIKSETVQRIVLSEMVRIKKRVTSTMTWTLITAQMSEVALNV